MKHSYTQLRSFILLCCLIGSFSATRAEIPFINNLVTQDSPSGIRLFDTSEAIPFLSQLVQANTDQAYAGALEMMDCFDVFTVGDDQTACFGDTVQLIGLATFMGNNQAGRFYVTDGSGGSNMNGTFLNTDGTAAQNFPGGNTYFTNSFNPMSGADTILFIRDASDPASLTDYQVVFLSQNAANANCIQLDTVQVRFDLAPNLTINVNAGMISQTLIAGAFPLGASLNTAFCSGDMFEFSSNAVNNPTLSGKPVFVYAEIFDTANVLGFGATDMDGDTINVPLNTFTANVTLNNNTDEDIFVSIKARPYHETDANSTNNGSIYNPGVDIIGDSIEISFFIYNEPIASFGGNDTICYAADVPLDFTGTPNTRVYYRDTLTGVLDSIDLDAQGRSVRIFNNVITDLFFVIDSLRRLDSPFCTASPATIAGIAPQPFIVLDSLVAMVNGLDTVACDTNGIITFDFFANDSASIYQFTLTNSLGNGDSTYFANGEDTLAFNLFGLDFGGIDAPRTITFYISGLVDTSSTSNCFNTALQDSFVVFVDPEPIVKLTVAGTMLQSDTSPTHVDTFCITDSQIFGTMEVTTSASGRQMYARVIDSLYNAETNMVISVDTSFVLIAGLNPAGPLAPSNVDTLCLVRTILPYFEQGDSIQYNDDLECGGGEIRLELLLTPAPLEPEVDFAADTICGGSSVVVNITGGTPGATVAYEITNEGVGDGVMNIVLDGSGNQTFVYDPPIDSGRTRIRLQFTFADCTEFLSQTDVLFNKPLPIGRLFFANDSICLDDNAVVIFNTPSTFADLYEVRWRILDPITAAVLTTTTANYANGDTLYNATLPDDRVFMIEFVRYAFGRLCANHNDYLDTIRVENMPIFEITTTEVSITAGGTNLITAPDSAYVEVCAGDSLYLAFNVPNPATDTSQFNDSLFIALTITDPLGVTPAGVGTNTVFLDIDELSGYDSLFLENMTNDTARIQILAIPYFTGVDAMGNPTTPFADACKGDSIEITIDVINNFVTTIGGNYEVCFGADTIVVITGPDFAEVDYTAIYEVAPGDNDTSTVRTITLDGNGRFEIVIDSILQDTIYDLIEARLPGSGCTANLGPNITVTVVPPPIATFAQDSIEQCQGTSFIVSLSGPAEGFARVYDSLGMDTVLVMFNDFGVGTFTWDSLVGNTKFYVDSVVFNNGMGLVCVTDTITDSLYVTQLIAPILTLESNIVCEGDAAYVILNSNFGGVQAYDLLLDSAGVYTIPVMGAENGDTVLTIPNLTQDSVMIFLVTGTQTGTGSCATLPIGANADTLTLRVQPLPELIVAFSSPVVDTFSAARGHDTLVVCYDDFITDTVYTIPATSIFGAAPFVNATLTIDGFNLFTDITLPTSALQANMASFGPSLTDSVILEYQVIPYFENGGGFGYDPGVDCAGDTVNFTLIILPTPLADFVFGQDTICENSTTTVDIAGRNGDVVSLSVEGLGSQNITISTPGRPIGSLDTFSYNIPTTDMFPAFATADNRILFAILSVTSATDPSCTNNSVDVDTLFIEELPVVTLTFQDTTVCTGGSAVLQFNGSPNATVNVGLDYSGTDNDTMVSLVLDAMGNNDSIIPNFRDTLVVTIFSVSSASNRACVNDTLFVSDTLFSLPLPDGRILADTVCADETASFIFDYQGSRTLTMNDSFRIVYLDTMGMMVVDTVMDNETFATASGPGTYTLTLQSLEDLTIGCDTTYMPGLMATAVVEEVPNLTIAFSGGLNSVFNGETFNTEVPVIFPNTTQTTVCSGTEFDMVVTPTPDASSAGDPVYALVTVVSDPFNVFGGLTPNTPTALPIAALDIMTTLINNGMTTETLRYRVTAYFETDPGMGATYDPMTECVGTMELDFIINVAPNPTAMFENMDTMRVCSGDTIFLKFDGTTNATVSFADTDGNMYSTPIADSVRYIATATGPDTIKFGITQVSVVTGGIGITCTSMPVDTVVLIINPLSDPYLEFAARDTLCFGESVSVIFRDSVGTAPWQVVLNGTTYTVPADSTTLFTTVGLEADSSFTISSSIDSNGCAADTIVSGVVFSDTVRVNVFPTLSTDVALLSITGMNIGTATLESGLIDTNFCSLQALDVESSTTTPMGLGGNPLWVRVAITGDVNDIFAAYSGDTTLFVPVDMVDDVLNTAAITNDSDTSITALIILTPYFETTSGMGMNMLDAGECSGEMDSLRITIDPRPEANPTAYSFTICSGDEFSFELANNMVIENFQLGTTFSYTTMTTDAGGETAADPRPMASSDDIVDTLVNISLNAETVTYNITPFSPGGCEGADFTIDVTVNPEPVLASNQDTICSGEGSMLRVNHDLSAVTPNRYIVADVQFDAMSLTAIDVIAIGDTFMRNNADPTTDNIFIRDTFRNVSTDTQRVDYFLIPLRLQTGCTGDTVIFSLFIAPEPLVDDRDTLVCTDVRLNIDLQATVANGVASTFTWRAVSGDFALIDGETIAPQVGSAFITDSLRLTTSAGSQIRQITYQVDVFGVNGCPITGPNSYFYTVFVSPNINLTTTTPQGDFICSGDPDGILVEAIASNTIGAVNYNWSITNVGAGVTSTNIINPTGNGSSINVNATGNGQFTLNLEVDDEGGCDAFTSLTITVYGSVIANFDTTYVGGITSATVDFTDTSIGFPTQWMWTFGDPASGASDTSIVRNPTHTFSGPGTYDVTLRAIRQAFCPDTSVVTKQVFIGFTPTPKCDTIILYPGFNVISLDVDTTDNSVEDIFDEIISFESTPGNSNLNQVIGIHPDISSSPLIYTQFFQTLTNIRPGFGYVVNVDVRDTLIVCGTSIDPNLRVDLQAGMNVVGYTPEASVPLTSYFDSIIADGNLSLVQGYNMGVFQFWTPTFSTLNTVRNGLGYVLDVSAAYTGSEWRENDNYNSSNFEYLYGGTSFGTEAANFPVEVVDASGKVYASFDLNNAGEFMPAFLFGIVQDVNSHETFGIPNGTELRFRINGQLSTTTHVFNGGWSGTELYLEFEDVLQSAGDFEGERVSFNVFPNPARNFVNVKFTTAKVVDNLHIEMISATGQLVSTQRAERVIGEQNFEIDARRLPAGVYLVRFITDGIDIGSEQVIIRK